MSAPELSPGDELANDLEARRRRMRILAEVEALEVPADELHRIRCRIAHPERFGVQRANALISAAYALAAIEAIDKECGR